MIIINQFFCLYSKSKHELCKQQKVFSSAKITLSKNSWEIERLSRRLSLKFDNQLILAQPNENRSPLTTVALNLKTNISRLLNRFFYILKEYNQQKKNSESAQLMRYVSLGICSEIREKKRRIFPFSCWALQIQMIFKIYVFNEQIKVFLEIFQ